MKNKLTDLNDHLFCQLERLSDEKLKGDKLREEIERAKSISAVSRMVIDNARLVLDANVAAKEHNIASSIPMIGGDK